MLIASKVVKVAAADKDFQVIHALTNHMMQLESYFLFAMLPINGEGIEWAIRRSLIDG